MARTEEIQSTLGGLEKGVVSPTGEARTRVSKLAMILLAGTLYIGTPEESHGDGIQVADASNVVTPASMTDASTSETPLNFELPTEFHFSNAQNESFIVSGNPDDLFVAWSLQQVFSVIPDAQKDIIQNEWMGLSIDDMKQVLAIHAGQVPLDGQTPAHVFYQNMLVAFLEMGRNYYIENAPKSDPEGWEGSDAAYISADWDDFIEKYSQGETNTDLDYRVLGNPDFFKGMSIFFPHHPVTAEIMIELDTIARKANIAEGKANIAEGKANIARDLAEAERYRQISLALRELTATLNGAIESVTTN